MVLAKISKYLGDKAGPEGASRAVYTGESVCLARCASSPHSLHSQLRPRDTCHACHAEWTQTNLNVSTHTIIFISVFYVRLNIGLNIKSNTVSTYWGSSLTFAWTRCVECPGIRQRGTLAEPGSRAPGRGSLGWACRNVATILWSASQQPIGGQGPGHVISVIQS